MAKHIFISYPWANKNQLVAVAIQQKLESIGYRVWIDLNEMSGDMTQKMIEAINDASLVVALISEEYEKSENCQKEYKFSQRRKKSIEHVVTAKGFIVGEQENSKSHWLAFLMPADVLYHRVYKEVLEKDKNEFDAMVEKFVVHIQSHYQTEMEEAFDKLGVGSRKGIIRQGVKIPADQEICRELLLSSAANETENVSKILKIYEPDSLEKYIWKLREVVYKGKKYTGLDGRSWFANMNALDFAALWASPELVEILVKSLFKPNQPENTQQNFNNFATSKSIFHDKYHENAFLLACSNDNLEVVKYFISINPKIKDSVDRDGCNALHLSAWLGGMKVTTVR